MVSPLMQNTLSGFHRRMSYNFYFKFQLKCMNSTKTLWCLEKKYNISDLPIYITI